MQKYYKAGMNGLAAAKTERTLFAITPYDPADFIAAPGRRA